MAPFPEQPGSQPGSWKQGFGRRLGYYLFGITLGFVILGLFHAAKRWAAGQPPPAATQPTPVPLTPAK